MLSVVIPTLNEAAQITSLIAALRDANVEIIVSDGGSSDETVTLARAAGARIIEGARGRGAQLNAGAHAATGDVLWFVHADARPHRCTVPHIQKCLQNPEIIGGNFRLRFAGSGWAPHLFSRIARQQRRRGVYYGDSGLWVRRHTFEKLGGFRDWPLFEDYDFARRLEKFAQEQHLQTDYAPWPIYASPRRFAHQPSRVLFQWLLLQALFWAGAPPQRLAQWYRRGKI